MAKKTDQNNKFLSFWDVKSGYVFFYGRGELKTEFFDLGMQGGSWKPKEFCRLWSISIGKIECFADNDIGKPVHAIVKAFVARW